MAVTTRVGGNAGTQDSATDRMQDALDELADSVSGTADRWSEMAQGSAQRLFDDAGQYAERLGERRERVLEDTRDYIAAHPLRTLGIAAAAGFLIGRMLR